jgi:pimeloyl-ACP methyl ester carboxylesterase
MIGSPITLSSPEPVRTRYLDGLSDRYRVILLDYPTGREDAMSFTPDRVSNEMLAVADAVDAERFAWFGFSWGAVVGLQLAARTNRLAALVCGGWPPIAAPYAATLRASETLAARIPEVQPMVTYYRALQDWPEREVVAKFAIPRLTFAGTDDVMGAPGSTVSIGLTIAEHREELERIGWIVRLVERAGHDLINRPDVVVPIIREFLDPVLLP